MDGSENGGRQGSQAEFLGLGATRGLQGEWYVCHLGSRWWVREGLEYLLPCTGKIGF